MDLSQLNLDVDTYTDAHLQKNFGLDNNYSKEQVVEATSRLANIAANTLGPDAEQAFNNFLRAAEDRLLKKKLVEQTALSNNYAHLDTDKLLPSDRELTVIPENQIKVKTHSRNTGVVATLQQEDKEQAPASVPTPIPVPTRVSESKKAVVSDPEDMVIQLPLPPQVHSERWKIENHKNITSRIVSIDSTYRQNISTITADGQTGTDDVPDTKSIAFNTDFTLDLSEPLTNVVSLTLNSVQIPTTWYAFDHHLGNTSFSRDLLGTDVSNIKPGNYDLSGLTQAIREEDTKLNFTINPETNTVDISATDTGKSFTYYKEGGLDEHTQYVNQNLGWHLGLRYAPDRRGIVTVDTDNIVSGHAPANTYGPKYFMLALEDYNQNARNKGLLNVTDTYAPISAIQTSSRVEPSPITKAQLYSQNAQLGYDNDGSPKQTVTRAPGPQNTHAFAIIPLKGITALRNEGEPFVDYDLRSNIRTYSSPVDINRIRVRLFDDKGNLVNLHDNDWSFSLIVEQVN